MRNRLEDGRLSDHHLGSWGYHTTMALLSDRGVITPPWRQRVYKIGKRVMGTNHMSHPGRWTFTVLGFMGDSLSCVSMLLSHWGDALAATDLRNPRHQQDSKLKFASHQTTPHDCFFFPSDQLKAASSTHTGDTAPIEAGQLFFTVHQIYYAPSIEPLLFSSLLSRQTPVLSHCFSALLIAGVCDSYLWVKTAIED